MLKGTTRTNLGLEAEEECAKTSVCVSIRDSFNVGIMQCGELSVCVAHFVVVLMCTLLSIAYLGRLYCVVTVLYHFVACCTTLYCIVKYFS